MSVNVGSATGYLDLDISGFLAGLQSAQAQANQQSKNIATTIGNNLASAGSTLTKGITVPILGIGAAGLKVATDFEKGMSEVRAISGATGKDFDALRNKAIELGASTAFSSNEVAAAMTEMAKAGWNTDQIISGMSGVLDAAAASGEELGVVSTIVADAVTGFGMAASDSTRIADLLTQAANSGTIGITDLGETFKYISPIAGAMGLSIEDVTTAVSAMSMAGIKGSSAGTALRTMLTNLVNPAGQSADAIEILGLSAVNADGSMKSLDEIVSMLRTSFSGLTEAEKSQYAAMLAGQEGMSGLLSLLNLTEEEYNAIAESMDNSNGVAQETANVMQDNLQSKVEQLFGSLESLAITLADYLIPYVQQFVLWLTSLVEKFTALDPELQKTILKFVGFAAAIGPVMLVVGKLMTGVGALVTSFGKLKLGFDAVKAGGTAASGMLSKFGGLIAGVTGPMIAVVAVIGLVAAAFTSLWKNNEEFRTKVTEIWNQITSVFDGFTSGIVERLNALGFEFESITEVIKVIWQGFTEFLAPIFIGAFQYIADTFQTITGVILGIVDFFTSVFQDDWEGAWNAVKGIFATIWNGIVANFENVTNMLKEIVNVFLGWFGTSWEETWNSIKTFFSNTWDSIVKGFKDVITSIKTTAKNLMDEVISIGSDIVDGVWQGIQKAKDQFTSKVKGFFSGIVNSVKSVLKIGSPSKVFADEVGHWMPFGVVDGFESALPAAMKRIQSALNGAVGNLSTSSFSFGIDSAVMSAADKLKRMYSYLLKMSGAVVGADGTLGYVGYNGFVSISDNQKSSVRSGNGIGETRGDIFNFYSPVAIDEVEAARQMKKAKRDLAEDF